MKNLSLTSKIKEIKKSYEYDPQKFCQEIVILNNEWEEEKYIVMQGVNFIDIYKK